MPFEPTSAIVRGLYDHLQRRYGSRLVDRSESKPFQVLADLVSLLGIADRESYLRRTVTTIGHTIYAPFTPGEASPPYDLWTQIVVAAHEHEHIVQAEESGGDLAFILRYLVSPSDRAVFEARAFFSTFELEYWRYGEVRTSVDTITKIISGSYGLGANDVLAARAALVVGLDVARVGGLSPATREVIKYLAGAV